MKTRSRTEILDFLTDLAGPLGPEIWAGFGSPEQAELAQEPFMAEPLIEDWVAHSEGAALLRELIAIATATSLESEYETFRDRFRAAWDFYLAELIYAACAAAPAALTTTITELARHPQSAAIAEELALWVSEAG